MQGASGTQRGEKALEQEGGGLWSPPVKQELGEQVVEQEAWAFCSRQLAIEGHLASEWRWGQQEAKTSRETLWPFRCDRGRQNLLNEGWRRGSEADSKLCAQRTMGIGGVLFPETLKISGEKPEVCLGHLTMSPGNLDK